MKYNQIWSYEMENIISKLEVNEIIEENSLRSIKRFYTNTYEAFKAMLKKDRKEKMEKYEKSRQSNNFIS